MADLTHLWKVGQPVKWRTEDGFLEGEVREVHPDYLLVNVYKVSDHCKFQEGINLGDLYPVYNF